MRSLAGAAKAARHAAVLDEAAIEFNRAGVAGASLANIAERVGISRAGLYNYCADREDLVQQAYLRACALTDADLRRAGLSAATGLDRVVSFLRLALDLDHAPMAVLSEIAFLSPDRRAPVLAARARNIAGLGALIGAGIEDGSIRPCDVDLACQSILGILSWTPLSRGWSENPDELFAIRMAAAIPTLVADGVAAPGAPLPQATASLAQAVPPSAAPTELDQKLEALGREGSRLFNQRGIDGVSLDDVAAAVGATKGFVYHHFDNKLAFVAFCYARAFDLYDRLMAAAGACATGLEAAMTAVELNVQAQIEGLHPISLSTGFEMFTDDQRKAFTARTSRLADRSVAIGRRGIKDGTLRAYDLEAVSMASAGTFSYLSKWLPPGDNRPAQAIGREIARFFTLGLRNRSD
ncbi:TetR/AcrR family transcriptional regulator [Caulobacter sp. KR2-114]|uniref:TetR/AcrR family transcriptional regulator n=1 Tax=Caulobacter sp. KR2-114 TaxID=3400912 RepID=UPI003BFFADDC